MPVRIELNKVFGSKQAEGATIVSPEKGKKRITRTSDLPLPVHVMNAEAIWTTTFVLCYIAYVGLLANLWNADSKHKEDRILCQLWLKAFEEELGDEGDLHKVRDIMRDSFHFWHVITAHLCGLRPPNVHQTGAATLARVHSELSRIISTSKAFTPKSSASSITKTIARTIAPGAC